jgi:hypothetical protein
MAARNVFCNVFDTVAVYDMNKSSFMEDSFEPGINPYLVEEHRIIKDSRLTEILFS